MTSKIVVNNIEEDAGVSTVTFNSNVERGSSNLHSTGLNVNNTFVHSTGIALGAGSTVGAVTGVTTYYGDGSQLTGTGPTFTNGADNRVITATSASAITGEANLTFNGGATGDAQLTVHAAEANANSDSELILETSNDFATSVIMFKDSTAEAGSVAYNHGDNYIKFSTNGTDGGTERMRISSDGYVTKPNTPAFHVSRQGGDVSANNYVTFDHADYNNGSHYNTSHGKFTAPVTGIYFFSAWHFTGGTSAFYLRINGTTFGEYTWDDTGGCGTWVCPMTSGQYAQIYTKYTWRGTSDYHNAFCGYLIG